MTNEIAVCATTLYDCLGGGAALRKAVALFYERVPADPQLAPFFAGPAMDRLRSHRDVFLSHIFTGKGMRNNCRNPK